jgi:hypothetical protein
MQLRKDTVYTTLYISNLNLRHLSFTCFAIRIRIPGPFFYFQSGYRCNCLDNLWAATTVQSGLSSYFIIFTRLYGRSCEYTDPFPLWGHHKAHLLEFRWQFDQSWLLYSLPILCTADLVETEKIN